LSHVGVSQQDFLGHFGILWSQVFAGRVDCLFRHHVITVVGRWRQAAGFTKFCQTAAIFELRVTICFDQSFGSA
jgi:hypothetical protein